MRSSRSTTFGIAIALLAIAVASSCRDVVGSSDVNALDALCSTVGKCYEDAPTCDTLSSRAAEASDDARIQFLEALEPTKCLDTCAGSRACLDTEMLCLPLGAECDPGFDTCCEFTQGTRKCSSAGSCCATKGAPCGSDGDCCALACENGYCGGRACVVVGEACKYGFECCTDRCTDGVCERLECSLLGEPCLEVAECCPVEEIPGFHLACSNDGGVGTCAMIPDEGECLSVGVPCAVNASSGEPACCEGLTCETAAVSQGSYCVPPGCRTAGFDCAADADCCGELICNLALDVSFCVEPVNCAKADSPCVGDGECCSGVCFENACLQGSGTPCQAAGTCHAPTEAGPSIPAGCTAGSCPTCIDHVREQDVFCACTAWDPLCVQAYEACVAEGCPG